MKILMIVMLSSVLLVACSAVGEDEKETVEAIEKVAEYKVEETVTVSSDGEDVVVSESSDSEEVEVTESFDSKGEETPEPLEDGIAENQISSAAYRYFSAVDQEDMDGFLGVFSDDATITVVSRQLDSQERIMNFAENEVFGGLYEIYRAEITETGIRILLQFTPEGWANPEPMAVYDFTIENDQIVSANLQYATEDDKEYFEDLPLNGTPLLPKGFNTYLEGVTEDDSDKLVSGFTEDAVIIDVSRTIKGREDIKAWADREVLQLNYEVLKLVYKDGGVIVHNHISFGTGSGFFGSYDLDISQGLIIHADLQYADEEEMYYVNK